MSAGEVCPSTDKNQGEAPSSSIKTEYAQDSGTVTYAGNALKEFIEKGRAWAEQQRLAETSGEAQPASH